MLQRVPVTTTLGIEKFTAGVVDIPYSRTKNVVYGKRPNGTIYASQRPGINIFEDASDTVSNARGRGIYYWDAVGALYFVNNNKVYKSDYSTEVNEAAQSVTSITRTGDTATVTITAHGYATGDLVTISGANEADYNGEFVISNVAANTFDYTVENTPTTPATGTIEATRGLNDGGTERVEFFEVGDYLVIIDVENNNGWYITSGASTTLVEITDADFPSKNSLTLARGGAVLNGTMYVYCTNGEIYNSATEDPTSWGSLDFITSEVNPDGGVMLYKHSDHLAAIGNRTIEFFYDNANPTGSPLNPRQDIVHDIGAVDYNTAWADAQFVFFVGITSSGDVGVYVLNNFQIRKISDNDMDSMLTSAVTADSVKMIGSGFSSGGRNFYTLTMYNVQSDVVSPVATYIYDNSMGWSVWDLMHTGIDHFPLISWTQGVATRAGQGILSNGDIITALDDFTPTDTVELTTWVADGWVEPGYFTTTGGTGTDIQMEIITGPISFGTRTPKYQSNLRVVCTPTDSSETITVQWSDNGNNNYNAGRTIDLSNIDNRLNRCGRFKTRNFKLTYSGSEQIELEGIEGDFHATV